HEAERVWERFVSTARRAAERLAGHPITRADADLGPARRPKDSVTGMEVDFPLPGRRPVTPPERAALNAALAAGDAGTEELAGALGSLRGMLDVLGLDPLSAQWAGDATAAGGEHQALDALVTAQLAARQAARAEKDWARADALRDSLTAAGIRIEDGPDGARWTLETTN